jgi:hypothetical protein
MRVSVRVALVSLIIATGGFAGCSFSLDRLSDAPSEGLVSPEYPSAKIAPGEETTASSAKDGESGTQAAPPEKKGKPAQKSQRPRTAKVAKKPAASGRTAAAQPQTPEPKSVPTQGEPLQHPWPTAPADGTFSR